MPDHRSRTDHEVRSFESGLFLSEIEDESEDGLDGLPESHVVREEGVEVMVHEPVKPVDPLALVAPELEPGIQELGLYLLRQPEPSIQREVGERFKELAVGLVHLLDPADGLDELLDGGKLGHVGPVAVLGDFEA